MLSERQLEEFTLLGKFKLGQIRYEEIFCHFGFFSI